MRFALDNPITQNVHAAMTVSHAFVPHARQPQLFHA